ncbi:signal peptide protein [Peptacetobacter hominis]|uniref:Signal peptide protein n=1 Tax=Peptacetobacter hominis TaxID=2743610 RepID=A0A544QV46_9FIRM|nr:hypothetical protein [Peptacetobacter hominis]TQQ84556.1 signal peptide protein [Peptacetobacter hominis]
MNKKYSKDIFPETPESFKDTVRMTLDSLPEEEEHSMKFRFRKRGILIAAAIMVVGTTVFAAQNITSIVGNSSNIAFYEELPTEDQIMKDFSFKPVLLESFSNGFKFDKAYKEDTEGLDDNGNSVDKAKNVIFDYKKGNEVVTLESSAKKIGTDQISNPVDSYKGTDIFYSEDMYKFVPADYEMTEQDKKDEKSGKYIFSYGTSEVEIQKFKHISWEKGGVYYSLYGMDLSISEDDMIQMVHEAIDAK